MNVIIRHMKEEDSKAVAELHHGYIRTGLISRLGVPFLKLLYSSMVHSDYAFCFVAECDGNIIGFVSGSLNIKNFYIEFIKRNFWRSVVILLSVVFKPELLRGILETLLYPFRKREELPLAELLSIAVSEEYWGKGVSKELFEMLQREFSSRGIQKFKVVVGSNLKGARRFYEKMGCIFYKELMLHRGVVSNIYVCKCGCGKVGGWR